MYKELSDYINKNNLKMSAMTFDDELLSNARKNSIMRNMISDYLMDALQEKRRLPIPITLKEVNEIMPKRSVGKGFLLLYTLFSINIGLPVCTSLHQALLSGNRKPTWNIIHVGFFMLPPN